VVEAWIEGAWIADRLVQSLLDQFDTAARRVGAFERDDLEERGAEPEDIGLGAYALRIAAQLLRRHVAGRAEHFARHRQVLAASAVMRKPEVDQTGLTGLIDEDVAGLDVAVDHASAMRFFESQSDVPQPGYAAHEILSGDRARATRLLRGALFAQELRQRLAGHVLHRKVRCPLVFAQLEDAADCGVPELRDAAGFAQEALTKRGLL
jgi:hypothetical protein